MRLKTADGGTDAAAETKAPRTLAEISAVCGSGMPLPPTVADSAFDEPWQAHAFALTVLLHEAGRFTWTQWAAALSARINSAQAAGDSDDGLTYYQHWLAALEDIVIAQGLGTSNQIHALAHAWAEAAMRTPHGQPIELDEATIQPYRPPR